MKGLKSYDLYIFKIQITVKYLIKLKLEKKLKLPLFSVFCFESIS